MKISRRYFAAASVASILTDSGRPSRSLKRQSTVLRISHQFPGGTKHAGDFRDRLCRRFAEEVTNRSHGALTFRIYPGASLMKPHTQVHAIRIGALDMSLLALSYAGGEVPEINITAMPGMVTSYQECFAWKHSEIGRALTALLSAKGMQIVSWIWQAGAVASRTSCVLEPSDVRGVKIRGGSREMDVMLESAGATVVALPSNELYVAMQTGAMDAAVSTATSLISFRLQEVTRCLTTARGGSFWYVFTPLLISRIVFERLPPTEQAILMQVGSEIESVGMEAAKADDARIVSLFTDDGVAAFDLDRDALERWRRTARQSAWESYRKRSASCANFLRLAQRSTL